MQFAKERMQPQTACPWLHANILVHSGGWAFDDSSKSIAGMLDTQVLDLMLWCKETLLNVLQHQQALPEQDIQHKLQEIQSLSRQDQLSSHLQLVLKPTRLLLGTLLKLRTALLKPDIQ